MHDVRRPGVKGRWFVLRDALVDGFGTACGVVDVTVGKKGTA